MILWLLFMSLAEASDFRGHSIIRTVEMEEKPRARATTSKEAASTTRPAKTPYGNLPMEYGRKQIAFDTSDRVVFVSKADSLLAGIRSGTILRATIEQEVVVSQNVPNPVRAVVVSENLKGAYLLGEATLDRDLKRALLNFTKLQIPSKGEVYSFRGQALELSGRVGLEGTYHNQSAKFFVGEFASAAAAGFLDAGITRNQTIQGGYVTEPSLSNAGKAGAVSALTKSTERFAEAARSASDYTEISPIREIQIIVQDEPTLQR